MADLSDLLLMQRLSGASLGIPDYLLGPTGDVFLRPDGYSTELGTVVSDDDGARLLPLLSRNQGGIMHLLAGAKVKPKQVDLASQEIGASASRFGSVPEALDAESARHEWLQQQLLPYLLGIGR